MGGVALPITSPWPPSKGELRGCYPFKGEICPSRLRDEGLLSGPLSVFLLIHPSEAEGEAIPPEPEARIGSARKRAYDVSKNGSGKRKNPHPEDLFMLGCVRKDMGVYRD